MVDDMTTKQIIRAIKWSGRKGFAAGIVGGVIGTITSILVYYSYSEWEEKMKAREATKKQASLEDLVHKAFGEGVDVEDVLRDSINEHKRGRDAEKAQHLPYNNPVERFIPQVVQGESEGE